MATQVQVRIGHAGNGTPVFLLAGQSLTLGRIFGGVWDAARGLWMYPAFYPALTAVLADFRALAQDVTFTWSEGALAHIGAMAQVQEAVAAHALPAGFDFVTPPYQHQLDGLCHIYHYLRAALYYEQGLGKSKIAIDLLRLLRQQGEATTTLILGPKVTIQNWGREVDLHAGRQLTWTAITGTAAKKKALLHNAATAPTDIYLATYDTVRTLATEIQACLPYTTLICDEAHNVKSWDSARTQATWEVAQKAKRRVVMTGSPTQGSPLDLYGIYKILGDCFMPEPYWKFKKTYLQYASANSHVVTGYKHLDVLNRRTLFLSTRRTKAECLDLPARTLVDVEYTLSKLQRNIHNQLVTEMRLDPTLLALQLGLTTPTQRLPPEARMPHRAATLSKLLQVASGFLIKNEGDPSFCDQVEVGGCRHLDSCVQQRIRPRTPACLVAPVPVPNTVTFFDENPKLEALAELLEGIVQDPTHKVIIWCTFRHELTQVATLLRDRNWQYVQVDGDTKDVQQAIDAFNNLAAVQVYVAQASTGVGITLNAAAYMIYFSLPFSLTIYTQSLDRNYRIGQDKAVTVYRLLGQGTPEPAIARLLDNKIDVDRLLTTKIDCLVCPNSLPCATDSVEPFDAACIHPRSVLRPVIKAHVMAEELNPEPESPCE